MKRKSLILCFCFAFLNFFAESAFAQKKKKQELPADANIYLYKADWSGASSIKEAIYFMQVIKQNDSSFICRYYRVTGPMVRQESYKDEDLSIPNGRFCWYDVVGNLDSTGWVTNKHKDYYWDYYKDGKHTLTIKYDNGKYVNKTDYIAKIFYDDSGNQISLDEKQKEDSIRLDSFKTVQVEAKFQNGTQDWIKYIQKNLKTPDRLINVLGTGQHSAIVVFMVNKQGNIDRDMYLMQSVEWSGDAEVFALILNSPPWHPAVQNGDPVFYRMRQSLTFEVNSY